MIEQAIYASTRSGQRDGYQVVAASPGVSPDDLRELSVWCPSHDGLLDATGSTPSLNAFPLPSGGHCVARSFAAAAEYSGRGGLHVVTHALVLTAEDYLPFANNPFAVMQAAVAAGRIVSELPADKHLAPFRLLGRARVFDRSALRQAVAKFSLNGFAAALDTCVSAETAVLAMGNGSSLLLTAILTCLPVGVRTRVSLATGLVYSPRRPYQWIAYHSDANELRRLERSSGLRVVKQSEVDEARSAATVEPNHAWAAFVYDRLADECYLELEHRMRDLTAVASIAELDRVTAAGTEASAPIQGLATAGSSPSTKSWAEARP